MMVFGVLLAFVLAFLLFPSALLYFEPGKPSAQRDITAAITAFFARLIKNHGRSVLATYGILAVLSVIGMTFLTVENRFIDYFKKSKGKTKLYLSDLKKPCPELKKKELKKITVEMIEEGTLMYYSTGSTTMLQLPEDDIDAKTKE